MLASRALSVFQEIIVKKGFVALLIALAVIILISPGIVGRLAEKSMDENLDWAATETEEVVVTSQGFDRGWFSSAGRHRVEVREGELREILLAYTDSDDVPALIIDTHLDHGLIPLTSMTRDKGSLAPGLGSAISTLSIESADGSMLNLPGTIYSTVGLAGELRSNYVLGAGDFYHDDATAKWGDIDVVVTTSPSSGDIGFEGSIESFDVESIAENVRIEDISFEGEQRPTPFGFRVGPVEGSIAAIRSDANGQQTIGPVRIRANSEIDDGRLSARSVFEVENTPFQGLGDAGISVDIRLEDADGRAIGNIKRGLESIGPNNNPDDLMWGLEADAKRLLAAGLELHIDEANITLPQGQIKTEAHIVIDDSDVDSLTWTSVLLQIDASADVRIAEDLMDIAMAMDQQVTAAVGMGFLQKKGDAYEMHAEFKSGLLTINGAPMSLPLFNNQ